MLILTRKKNQDIMIGDKIKITILETTGDTVKIGIDAPVEITILRGELYQAVKEENISASTVDLNIERSLAKLFLNRRK